MDSQRIAHLWVATAFLGGDSDWPEPSERDAAAKTSYPVQELKPMYLESTIKEPV